MTYWMWGGPHGSAWLVAVLVLVGGVTARADVAEGPQDPSSQVQVGAGTAEGARGLPVPAPPPRGRPENRSRMIIGGALVFLGAALTGVGPFTSTDRTYLTSMVVGPPAFVAGLCLLIRGVRIHHGRSDGGGRARIAFGGLLVAAGLAALGPGIAIFHYAVGPPFLALAPVLLGTGIGLVVRGVRKRRAARVEVALAPGAFRVRW